MATAVQHATTVDREFHPAHPRRASAGRRRRHRARLVYRVRQIAPDAVTVLCTPTWTDATGVVHIVYVVTARDAEGRSIRLPSGGCHRLATLLQGAFPQADWQRAQTWHADGNRLAVWRRQESAAFRETADAGFVESLTAFGERLAVGGVR